MKLTNKALLSLPKRQASPTYPATVSIVVAEYEVRPVVTRAELPIEPGASVAQLTPVSITQPEHQPVVSPCLSRKTARILNWTSLSLVTYFTFVVCLHLESEPFSASDLRPLPEINTPPIAPSEPFYVVELAFPFRETLIPYSKPAITSHQEPMRLKIGVYKQISNVEKWRRWAHQQNVAFEVVMKSLNGEPHYFLYLYDHNPARIDRLKVRVAEISGESPQQQIGRTESPPVPQELRAMSWQTN